MPQYSENKILPYTPKQMYDLVLDIERYVEFLPWCGAARIVERGDHYVIADLVIQYKAFSERYRSRVEYRQSADDFFIDVTMVDGPFQYLNNTWQLYKIAEGVRIAFFIDFKFKSIIFEKIIGLVFAQAAKAMVQAFELRAQKIYK